MARVAIVILNWNGEDFLRRFLPVLAEHSREAEVIVADNASADGSVEFLQESFPDIRVIRLDRNYGFAGGYNRALAQVEAEVYVIINSDIEVTEGWLQPVLAHLDANSDVAACQPALMDYLHRNRYEYAGASGGYIDSYGYPFCRGRIFQQLEENSGQYEDVTDVFWATGACMFVRSAVFHAVGGFDDDFFAHMEEIDLCWRIKQAGHRVTVVPQSRVYHVGGGTLPKNSPFKTYLNMRNNMVMLYKNLPSNRLFRVLAARWILDGAAALKFLFDGGIDDFWAVVRAHFHFYGNFGRIRKKRKSIKQAPVSCIYQGNIAQEYFINGLKKFTELDKSKFSV